MTAREIEAFLNAELAAHASPGSLGGGGEIDSLQGLELTLAVEEKFGIRLDDDQLTSRNLRSIPRLAQLLASKSSDNSGK